MPLLPVTGPAILRPSTGISADGQFGSGSRISHAYAYTGPYQVRLTVVNDNHEQGIFEHTIHIQGGDSPLAIVPVFVNGSEGYACYPHSPASSAPSTAIW